MRSYKKLSRIIERSGAVTIPLMFVLFIVAFAVSANPDTEAAIAPDEYTEVVTTATTETSTITSCGTPSTTPKSQG